MSYRKALTISIVVFLLFAVGYIASLGPLENTHLRTRDIFFRIRGPMVPNAQLTIVAIDDQSIAQYGRWPWPRARIGALVQKLSEYGARTIGIDISFLPSSGQAKPISPEADITPLLRWLDLDVGPRTSISNDQLLSLAIKKADNVILPFYFEFKADSSEGTSRIPSTLSHSAFLLFDDVSILPELPLLRGSSVFPPTQILAEAATGLGCVNAFLDRDGVLRSDPAIIGFKNQYFPAMGIQLGRLHLGLSWAEVKVNSGRSIRLGGYLIPTDNRGFVALNYYGGRESFPYISYKQVMEGNFNTSMVKDKLVLVGVSAAGLHDLWSTPFGAGYPGVEKLATFVANILDQSFIVPSEFKGVAEVLFMFLSALVLGFVAGSRRSWILWLFCVLLLGLGVAGSYWAFSIHHLWFEPLFPVLFVLSLSLVLQIFKLRSPVIVTDKVQETRVETIETMTAVDSDLRREDEVSGVGRYQIKGQLGHGAMGVVYKAVDPTIGRAVAIKTIRWDLSLAAEQLKDLRERSLREAQVAGRLSHPNIVTIYDVVEKGGNLFIAMEYIEGRELSDFCEKANLLEPRQATTIIAHICHGLDYAHKESVVHRDIKPSNIMLLQDGRPKIMDFGITKMISSEATQTAAMLGTPGYMSPEQIDLERVDGRSDLFSVGAMFYELLSGQRPFTGPNITAILKKIASEDPTPLRQVNPRVHPKLETVVVRLLAKNPDDRFQTGADVVAVLESLLADPSIWE